MAALTGLFGNSGAHWVELRQTVLPVYFLNTLWIAAGVSVLSLALGLVPALVLHRYSFPFSAQVPLLLALPLAIPAYISGMAYHAMLDYTSPLYVFLRSNFGLQTGPYLFFNLHSVGGVILVFSFSYAPYVFLLVHAAMRAFPAAQLEVARLLGASGRKVLFSLLLPHLRPALAAGLSLVLMEVLNDYGLVRFFGVETFTTGIFNAWFLLRDPAAAFRLAGMLMLMAFLLLLAEQWSRAGHTDRTKGGHRPGLPKKLRGWNAGLALAVATLPFVLGFLLPVAQLLVMLFDAIPVLVRSDFFRLLANSLLLALGAGLAATLFALALLYSGSKLRSRFAQALVLFATSGYAIPGAVIAIGLLQIVNIMAFTPFLSRLLGWLLTSTVVLLMYAYVARFVTASWNSVSSGATRIGSGQLEAARIAGAPAWLVFRQVIWPFLKPATLAGFIMVSMDVLKELPLTLLLRPFNFDTLAVRAFEFAADERIAEASPYALLIVVAGFVPVWLIRKNKMI